MASRARVPGGAGSGLPAVLARAHLTPTGGGLIVLALLGWVLGQQLGARALLMLVYLGLIAITLSYLLSRRRLRLSATRSDIDLRMREGQVATVELEIGADQRVSTVIVTDELDPVLGTSPRIPIASLGSGEVLEHAYTFTPARRGVYRIGPVTATWNDPFGLVVHTQRIAEAVEVIVHPATESVHDRVLSRMWEDPPIRPPVSKPWPTGFEFYGMRDYVPGDDLRRVVWSAVAKTDRMLVRESEQGITDRVVILLDTDVNQHSPGDPSETFETGVRAAASLGAHHLKDGFSVTCLANDGPLVGPLRGSNDARMALLDELARAQRTRTPFSGLSEQIVGTARRGSHLVVLTPHLDREGTGALRLALERGSSVTIALLVWEESAPDILASAAALGCEVVQLAAGDSLEAVFAHQIGAGIRA